MDEYRSAYRLAFDFHAKYAPFPPTGDVWQAAAADLGKASAAGGNNPFLNELLIAVYNEMERQWKHSQEQ